MQKLRETLDTQEAYKKGFKDDVFECLHHITDFKKLKAGVIRLHKKYVKEEMKREGGETDLNQIYSQRRKFLEQNVNYLRTMLQKDQQVHKKENAKIMSENVQLLHQINDQYKECHALRQKIKQNEMMLVDNPNDFTNNGMFGGDLEKESKFQDMRIDEITR